MTIKEIELLPEIKLVASVLAELEQHGLKEPIIASGYLRHFLTGSPMSDIDISYTGPVHYETAQELLKKVLLGRGISDFELWDVEGIWNAEIAYGITDSAEHLKQYYINSIDSVYLASDGKLHDATGYGFSDSANKTLRINKEANSKNEPHEEVYACSEGCRRIFRFGWTPTPETDKRIRQGIKYWELLTDTERDYFKKRLQKKYADEERTTAQRVYAKYGWGFVFDV